MKFKYTNSELFKTTKGNILGRADLSKKGGVDAEVQDIVTIINDQSDYCTTSSCAGRITLLERKSAKKFDANWLIASHQPVTFEQVKDKLTSENDAWFMQESFILHVFCRTIDHAEELLQVCRDVGFKRSGVIAMKNKIMVEIMGNEKVETIVIKDGKKLIDDEYLKILVDLCNTRMKSNRAKMDRFLLSLRENLPNVNQKIRMFEKVDNNDILNEEEGIETLNKNINKKEFRKLVLEKKETLQNDE